MRFVILSLVLLVSSTGIAGTKARPYPVAASAKHGTIQISKSSLWVVSQASPEDLAKSRRDFLRTKRAALISNLEQLLRREKRADNRLELNLRLGRLYLEEFHYFLGIGYEKLAEEMERYEQSKQKGMAPRLNRLRADVALERARSVYSYLIRTYPNHPRRDEMLYFYAVVSFDRLQEKPAVAALKELIEKYTKSSLRADALAQLGDYYFDRNEYADAAPYYDLLIEAKNPQLLSYGWYRRAWCHYNLGEHDAAIKRFIQVVEAGSSGALALGLKQDALRDIRFVFVDKKLFAPSIAFFEKQEDGDFIEGLRGMAQMYQEKGDYDLAVSVNEVLLKRFPQNRYAPAAEVGIAEAFFMKNDPDGGSSRLFETWKRYADGSKWASAQAELSAVSSAMELFQNTLLKYAYRFHDTALKTKGRDMLALSRSILERYVDQFPQGQDIVGARFHLGKIYFQDAAYSKAADQYLKVYELSKSKVRYEAIVQALACLDLELAREYKEKGISSISRTSAKKLADGALSEPTAYLDSEQRFIQVAEIYLRQFPKGAEVPDALYEVSYLQYVHFEFDKAFRGFETVSYEHKRHPVAPSAAILMLDILNRKGEYPKLVGASETLLKKGPELASFRKEVEDILRRSHLKIVQQKEDQQKFGEAAEGYLEYANRFGVQDESLYEKALYNAAINFDKAGRSQEAARSLEQFLRLFPKSQLRQASLLLAGKWYERMANFKRAAYFYSQLAEESPKHPQAGNALKMAGLFSRVAEDNEQAERYLSSYLKTYDRDRSKVETELVDLYLAKGSIDKAIRLHEEIRNRKGISGIEYVSHSIDEIELLRSRGKEKAAGKIRNQLWDYVDKHGRTLAKKMNGSNLLSQIAMERIRPVERRYFRTRLGGKASGQSLEKGLQKKLELLKELEEGYVKIVNLGSERWAMEAIGRSAQSYRHLAQEALAAPVPAHLKGKDIEQYRKEVQASLIEPFQQKALEYAERCLEEASELHLLSPAIQSCYGIAAELNPTRYPAVRSAYLPSTLFAHFNADKKGASDRFLSSGLFQSKVERENASVAAAERQDAAIRDVAGSLGEPYRMDLRSLMPQRTRYLDSLAAKLEDGAPSIEALAALAVHMPEKATPLIRAALQQRPNNEELHNLLAINLTELGQLHSAEIVWMSLQTWTTRPEVVQNNLGVLSQLKGDEGGALDYFRLASSAPSDLAEARINLGHYALRCHNSSEAMVHFQKAAEMAGDDVSVAVGGASALIQRGDRESVKSRLTELWGKYPSDPYLILTASFYLLDVEKTPDVVRKMLGEYLQTIPENDRPSVFEKALEEARKVSDEVASLF